jgi:hypothetical protein
MSFKSKPFAHMLVHDEVVYLAYAADSTVTAWNCNGQILHSFKGHNDEITGSLSPKRIAMTLSQPYTFTTTFSIRGQLTSDLLFGTKMYEFDVHTYP